MIPEEQPEVDEVANVSVKDGIVTINGVVPVANQGGSVSVQVNGQDITSLLLSGLDRIESISQEDAEQQRQRSRRTRCFVPGRRDEPTFSGHYGLIFNYHDDTPVRETVLGPYTVRTYFKHRSITREEHRCGPMCYGTVIEGHPGLDPEVAHWRYDRRSEAIKGHDAVVAGLWEDIADEEWQDPRYEERADGGADDDDQPGATL